MKLRLNIFCNMYANVLLYSWRIILHFLYFVFMYSYQNSYITILLVSNVPRPKWTGVFKAIYVPFICVSIDNKYSEKRIAV